MSHDLGTTALVGAQYIRYSGYRVFCALYYNIILYYIVANTDAIQKPATSQRYNITYILCNFTTVGRIKQLYNMIAYKLV